LLYDSSTTKRIKEGLRINTKESTANALELVHVNIPEPYAEKFIQAFELSSVHEKYLSVNRNIKSIYTETDEEIIIRNLLFDADYSYNAWTKASILYSFKDKQLPFSKTFIEPFTFAENAVLKQVAAVIITNN